MHPNAQNPAQPPQQTPPSPSYSYQNVPPHPQGLPPGPPMQGQIHSPYAQASSVPPMDYRQPGQYHAPFPANQPRPQQPAQSPLHPPQPGQLHPGQAMPRQPSRDNLNGAADSMAQMHLTSPPQGYPQNPGSLNQQQSNPSYQNLQQGINSPPYMAQQQFPPQPQPPSSGNSPPYPPAKPQSPGQSAGRKRIPRVYHDYLTPSTSAEQPVREPSSQGPPAGYAHQQPQQQIPTQSQQTHPDFPDAQPGYPSLPQQPPPPHPYADAPPPGPPSPSPGQQHINQPPHSKGQKISGPRMRIHDDAIPSPVATRERDQNKFDFQPFLTLQNSLVPHGTTDFVALDQGNSNPKFIRSTTYAMPASDEIAAQVGFPLGVIIQPFAPLRPEESEVPIVDLGESGPPRCSACRGYINPFCTFVNSGLKFKCNLCGTTTDVPDGYFARVDAYGRPEDAESRPELSRGTVDFRVPKDYWATLEEKSALSLSTASQLATSTTTTEESRTPQPLARIFAIDVSFTSLQCGMVANVAKGIRDSLYGETEDGSLLPPGTKVAIMTFDQSVHFYNLHPHLEQAQMLVVGDVEDMFLPLDDGLLVDVVGSRHLIDRLLDSLENAFLGQRALDASLGGVVGASLEAFRKIGGQLNVFLSCLPTKNPGLLQFREDEKLYGTDNEKNLFVSQNPYYRQVAEELAAAGVVVNLFLFPSQYIDVASIGVLSGITGGEVFFFSRFDPVRDITRVHSAISQAVLRETVYNATMRLRCSNGLRVTDHFGNFLQRNVTDLEFGGIDADKAIAARIQHDGKLSDKQPAYIQCAVLYTSGDGERRVRTHNLSLRIATVVLDCFALACMESIMTYLAKEAISHTVSKPLREVRNKLTEKCSRVLWTYRKYCAQKTDPGQLLLPEYLKLFPVYTLALTKTKALKGGPVVSDVRTHYMRFIKSMGVSQTMYLLYPRMFAVHLFTEDVGMPGPDGNVVMPPCVRLAHTRMYPDGVYFIASPQIVSDLYGVEDVKDLDIRMTSLPRLPTRTSEQLRNILRSIEESRQGKALSVLIARQGQDGSELEFANMLAEDSNNDGLSYTEYICIIHRNIQEEMKSDKYEEVAESPASWHGSW